MSKNGVRPGVLGPRTTLVKIGAVIGHLVYSYGAGNGTRTRDIHLGKVML